MFTDCTLTDHRNCSAIYTFLPNEFSTAVDVTEDAAIEADHSFNTNGADHSSLTSNYFNKVTDGHGCDGIASPVLALQSPSPNTVESLPLATTQFELENGTITVSTSSTIAEQIGQPSHENYRTVPVRDLISTFELQTRPTMRYMVVREDKMPVVSEKSAIAFSCSAAIQLADEALNEELCGFQQLVDDFKHPKGLNEPHSTKPSA